MSKITMFNANDSGNFKQDFIRLMAQAWDQLSNIDATSKEITFSLPGSEDVLTLTGSGFVVDGAGNLTAGTVTGVKMVDGGKPFFSIRDIAISAADFADTFDNGHKIDIADLFGPMTIFGSLGGDSDGGEDFLFGSSGDDVMHGNSGSDLLTGNGGADLLDGGDGKDVVSYLSGGGVTVSLFDPSRNTGDAQGDRYRDIEAVFGSEHKDSLQGDLRANIIIGFRGDDKISGLRGHDLLAGGKGGDILQGGAGGDGLFGGDGLLGDGGNDTFVYTALADSTVDKPGRDEILDFNGDDKDLIDLHKLDAVEGGGNDDFSFIGGDEFSALGQLRVSLKGNNTLVELNILGNKAADMAILLKGDHLAEIGASDFIL